VVAERWHTLVPGIIWQRTRSASNESIVEEVEMSEMERIGQLKKPKFRNSSELTTEQLNDPDFRLKQLAKLNKGKPAITCSKCHHCR